VEEDLAKEVIRLCDPILAWLKEAEEKNDETGELASDLLFY
jgi:hypothetical protein